VSKKNPLAAKILIEQAGAPDRHLGSIDFKILHREGQTGLISGAWLNPAGQLIAQLSMRGFPLGDLQDPKGPGRPCANEKHLAVLLAWALKFGELGGKRKAGEADRATAERFAYLTSDGAANEKTVRDIRVKQAKKIDLDLDKDALWIADSSNLGEGPPACSVLIEKPTFYQTQSGGVEILGLGAVWTEGLGARVAKRCPIKIEIDETSPSLEFEALKARGGPKIISVIRPGR
jgi:hypothetical protein